MPFCFTEGVEQESDRGRFTRASRLRRKIANMASDDQNKPDDELSKELEQLEEDVLRKLEEKIELEKNVELRAKRELSEIGDGGLWEQAFLMLAAAVMIFTLPFLHYLLGIVFTLFALGVSLIAGLTSPKRPQSVLLDLGAAALGTIFFEYSAIFQFHNQGLDLLFWLYQLLAFIFLLAAYFSTATYRRKILEKK